MNSSFVNKKKFILLLAGPTAVGKTALSVELAKRLQTVVVSCDSRQFYRELAIGTAKPTLEEQEGVPHYFIDSHSIQDLFGAGDYEREALHLLQSLFEQHDVVIVTGGSGLFIKALVEGLDEMPSVPIVIRNQLMERLEKEGLDILANELVQLDAAYAAKVDLKNAQRVVRALEMITYTGLPFSHYHQKKKINRDFEWIKIALDRPREELYARINERVEGMLAAGLLEEVRSVAQFRAHNALQTVGYKEVFMYFDGVITYEEMLSQIQQNTRRYAKRQLTWFRNQDVFQWFHPDNREEIYEWIEKALEKGRVNVDK